MASKTILGNGVMADVAKAGAAKVGAAKAPGRVGAKAKRPGKVGPKADGPGKDGEVGQNDGGIRAGEARRAFEAVRPMLEAFGPGDVVAPRIDIGRAAAIVTSVLVRDGAPERRAEFAKMARAGHYDLATLDDLPRLARATWYLRGEQLTATYDATGALVAEADSAAAYETRARMMLVLGHWLGDRRDIAQRLQQLREGSGYQDLARDLEMLAELYGRDDVREVIAHDLKHYRATDEGEAERLAGIIYNAIGLSEQGRAERVAGLTYRAATLMMRAYDEHRACGQFLFRKVEDVTATYPSLFSAVRSPRRRRQADEAPDDEAPDGEAPDGEAPDGGGSGDEGDSGDEAPTPAVPLGGA